MLIWIVEWVSVPAHLGVIYTTEPVSPFHQRKSYLVGRHVVEHVDKRVDNRQMHPNTEEVGVYHTLLNMADQRRTVAGLLQLIQQLPRCHGSQAKLSTKRLRRVTSASHSR